MSPDNKRPSNDRTHRIRELSSLKQDPESLERDNDAAINHMSDRVAMLKKITSDIHNEAESHHRLLDGLSDNMVGGRLEREEDLCVGCQLCCARRHKAVCDPMHSCA